MDLMMGFSYRLRFVRGVFAHVRAPHTATLLTGLVVLSPEDGPSHRKRRTAARKLMTAEPPESEFGADVRTPQFLSIGRTQPSRPALGPGVHGPGQGTLWFPAMTSPFLRRGPALWSATREQQPDRFAALSRPF